MTLVGIGRPTRAETQHKARVMQSRGIGNLAGRQTILEYLDRPEIENDGPDSGSTRSLTGSGR